MKRLYKSNTNRVISGVCGGIAEYLNVDPTMVRLAWIALTFFGGSGILIYIIAALVMPHGYNMHDGHRYDHHHDHDHHHHN